MPSLPQHVRLHYDRSRDRWVLLAPERVLELDEPALETLKLCDGKNTVTIIAHKLSKQYQASGAQVLSDITDLLQDLADRDFLRL